MDSRVDFALDRSRLLAPNMAPPGALGPMVSYGSDLSRAGTPSTMTSLAQYQSRFLPSTMSMHSPGTSFALMGGFLGNSTPGDNLKSLLPDMHQYWTPHTDGYPRFIINNPYTPFGPFLPSHDAMPTLLPPNHSGHSGASAQVQAQAHAAHCHRIYELQKDAFLASASASQSGLYGILPTAQPFLERAPSPPPPPPQTQLLSLNLAVVKQEPRDAHSCLGVDRTSSKSSEHRIYNTTALYGDACGKEPAKEPSSGCNGSASISQKSRGTSGHRCQPGVRTHQKAAEKREATKKVVSGAGNSLATKRVEHLVKLAKKTPEPVADSSPSEKLKAEACVRTKKVSVVPTQTGEAAVAVKSLPQQASKTRQAGQNVPVPTETNVPSVKVTVPTNKPSMLTTSDGHRKSTPKKNPVTSKSVACGSVTHGSGGHVISHASSGGHVASHATGSHIIHASGGHGVTQATGGSHLVAHSSGGVALMQEDTKGHDKPPVFTIAAKESSAPSVSQSKKQEKHRKSHGGIRTSCGDKAWEGEAVAVLGQRTCPQSSTSLLCSSVSTSTSTTTTLASCAATEAKPSISTAKTNNSVALQPLPTVSTITATSCETNTVTSVPATCGGTQSVFARSQPVVSHAIVTTAAALQLSGTSVTSQIATSALPYYHTLYTQSEGNVRGTSGVKKVQATTTFVPEVGTFKGPLIRNMSKGCSEQRVKSEHSAASCCHEGRTPARNVDSSKQGTADEEEGTSDGDQESDDDRSDLSAPSPSHLERRLQVTPSGSENAHGTDFALHHESMHYDDSCSSGGGGGRIYPCGTPMSFQSGGVPSPNLFYAQSGTSGYSDVALDFSLSKRNKLSPDGTRTQGACRGVSDTAPSKSVQISQKTSDKNDQSAIRTNSSQIISTPSTATPSFYSRIRGVDRFDQLGSHSSTLLSSLSTPRISRAKIRQSSNRRTTSPTNSSQSGDSDAEALNLSKCPVDQKPKEGDASSRITTAKSSVQSSDSDRSVHAVAECIRTVSKVLLSEKRCGSAPPYSSVPFIGVQEGGVDDVESEEPEVENPDLDDVESCTESVDKEEITEHIASNIPIGIAVAQQRADAGRADVRTGTGRSEHLLCPTDDDDVTRQLSHDYKDREDYLRQQKSVLTGAAKPISTGGLPPNLVVTGGDNPMAEDLRLRPLTNQWLAPSHPVPPSSWLTQNHPFALHPGIPTTGTTFDPSHHPLASAFKLAQDSLTGQLLFIPNSDYLDQNALWAAFQSGANSQTLPTAFSHLTVPISQHVPPTTVQAPDTNVESAQGREDESDRIPVSRDQREEAESACVDGSMSLDNGDRCVGKDKAITIPSNNILERDKNPVTHANSFVSADLTAQPLAFPYQTPAGLSGPQFPFVFNPALLSMASAMPLMEPLAIKTEAPAVQSRGTSPILLTPPASDDTARGGVNLQSSVADLKKPVKTCCVSVQTSTDLDPTPTARVTCKEQSIQTSHLDHLQPLSVICSSPEIALPARLSEDRPDLAAKRRDSTPLRSVAAVAAAAMAVEGNLDPALTSRVNVKHGGCSYNPFTDPQILQAADGLELLSTLAEKRPKCSSSLVDPKTVFPSPSDSFKSDTPLPCPDFDDASSVVDGEKSVQSTPWGSKVKGKEVGDVSPKWEIPRREAVQPQTGSDYKISPSLANMDALEINMRLRLAELQRQYREKQRELAKLQPKKDKDDSVAAAKRGRGRPRKRKIAGKKYDDESSNSSGGKTGKDVVVVKKRRPAEELVDRVFRKLPPAKLGMMKSFSLKHKRSPSFSTASSSDADTYKEAWRRKEKHTHDIGNLFTNLESSFAESAEKKKRKRKPDAHVTVTSATVVVAPSVPTLASESGLGLLAKFASTALSASFQASKRKSEDRPIWQSQAGDQGNSGTNLVSQSPENKTGGSSPTTQSPVNKITTSSPTNPSPVNKTRRESDTDNSDTPTSTCVKKRKPGRPRKCDPNTSTCLTETIWSRQSGLLQLSDVAQGKTWVTKAEEAAAAAAAAASAAAVVSTSAPTVVTSASSTSNKLVGSPAGQASLLAPLLLDEWSIRRSERIFLSDTSPLPSPNLQLKEGCVKAPAARDSRSSSSGTKPGARVSRPSGSESRDQRASSASSEKTRQLSGERKTTKDKDDAPADNVKDTTTPSEIIKVKLKVKDEKRDRDKAKVQKARSLQELTQRVKRKYSRNLCKKAAAEDKLRKTTKNVVRPTVPNVRELAEDTDSSSEGDNVPLSTLRERPTTPVPRSCIIRQEELHEGLQVLVFRDGLFYEGVVQELQAPDIYGLVITGQRGSRPHIYSREEILHDAIMVVQPGSQRYVTEGTRVCAYWSQQFRCLYPGTVAKTSPNPHVESSVNVEFDDGDSGRIPMSHIRLLPQDFPLVAHEPNPLLHLTKRRRRTTSEDEFRKSSERRARSSVTSDVGLARRNSKTPTLDCDNSDDGDVFEDNAKREKKADTGKDKGGKGSSVRTKLGARRSYIDKERGRKKKSKQRPSSREKRSAPILKPASFIPNKSMAKRENVVEDSEDSEEDDSKESEEDERKDNDSFSDDEKAKDKRSIVARSRTRKRVSREQRPKRVKSKKQGGNLPAFMTPRPLWRWAGRSTKRPGMRGKARKEFYRSVSRGSDHITVGDCAVFLSTGRDNCPYVGRVESLWSSWGGQMTVKVKWFYHPEETKGGQHIKNPKGALFESPHGDENDVQTISHKCQVLTAREYARRTAEASRRGQAMDSNTYYLAGYYDPTIGLLRFEPDVQ